MAANVKALAMLGNYEFFSPEQKIVNEQKINIMNLSKIENGQPEQKHNSEQKADDSTSAQVSANALVSGSGKFECLLCGRNKFTRKSPHHCVGGFRKHHIKWKRIN